MMSIFNDRKHHMHIMSVKEEYYNMLKSGKKTIELRLFDDKRQLIKIGDIIEFHNGSDEDDNFQAKVIGLHRANNFEELCKKIKIGNAGFEDKDYLMKILEEFYPIEKQNKNGVVGIEVIKIS